MRYFFNLSINGEIDGKSDDGQPESLADIQKLVAESFKQDLLAGVSVRSLNISVHEVPSNPPGIAGNANAPMGAKVGY